MSMAESKKWPPSKEEFRELYIEQNLKAQDISSMFGISKRRVTDFIKANQVYKPSGYHFQPTPKKGALSDVTNEELIELYINQNLAADEIAEKFGTTRGAVATELSKRKIKKPGFLRAAKQRERNIEKYGVVSTLQLKEVQDKISKTCLEKYGNSSVASVGGIKQQENLKINPLSEEEKNRIVSKRKQTTMAHFGVEVPAQSEEIRIKIKQTNIEKYGCENPMQNDGIKQRLKETMQDKYGVENFTQSIQYSANNEKYAKIDLDIFIYQYCVENMSVKQLSELYKLSETAIYSFMAKNSITKDKQLTYVHRDKTNLEKYGFVSAASSPEVRSKIERTNLQKYGYVSCLSSPEIKAKAIKTMERNGTVNTSSQQLKLYEMLKCQYSDNVVLNKAVDDISLDIGLNIDGCLIDVEYDGWYWHKDREDLDRKRDYFLYSKGYKVLRIRSAYALPTKEEIFNAIDYLVNTEHHHKIITLPDWIEKENKYNKL